MVDRRGPARDALTGLLQAYAVDLTEVDGKIVSIPRGGVPALTLPEEDLGAYVWESGVGDREGPPEGEVQVARTQELDLPYQVDYTYFDFGTDYQTANQIAIRFDKPDLQNVLTINTTLVLDKDPARQIAERILYLQWLEREQFRFTLPWKYLSLAPGDVILLPFQSSLFRVRIISNDVGLLGPLGFVGVLDDVAVLNQVAIGGAPPAHSPHVIISDSFFVAWSGNAIDNADTDAIGFYMAGAPVSDGEWAGLTVYYSRNNGATYEFVDALSDPATLGTADTALPAFTTTGYWDTTNTVDVTLQSGSLENSSDAAVKGGANAVLIGNEIVQFVTATPLGTNPDRYRLSRLLRGGRGTDGHWGAHVSGERVVLLQEGAVRRVDLTDDLIQASVLLKPLEQGDALATVTAQPLTITGDERKPYTVWHVKGTRNAGNDLTITWQARSREPLGWHSPVTDSPSYDVEILVTGVPVRTFSAISVETVTYLATEQSFDGITPGSPVTCRIYARGQYGRGYPTTATL